MDLLESYLIKIQKSSKKSDSPVLTEGIFFTAMIAWSLYLRLTRVYNTSITAIGRRCASFEGIDNRLCQIKEKIKINTDMLNKTKGILAKCQDDKCKAKIQKKAQVYQNKVISLHQQMKLSLQMAKGNH